jgi:DNA-directed RNA polymerase subunit RPC12/RpoP
MRCPQCGGAVERVLAVDGGCIEETVWTKGGLRRKVRPASYYACTACEWCSELAPPEPEPHPDTDEHRAGCVECMREWDAHEQSDGRRCPDCGGESCICS